MAYLFVVENGVAKPNTETLLISPFKEIWERDKTKNKEKAIKDFSFMEFMSSKKKTNPFSGYDDETRFERLKEKYYNKDWEMDELIETGLAQITEFQEEASETFKFYLSAKIAVEKMQDFFINFDFATLNPRGQPLYKPRDITSALNDTAKVLQSFNELKEKVEQELFESVKTRANKSINPFEV